MGIQEYKNGDYLEGFEDTRIFDTKTRLEHPCGTIIQTHKKPLEVRRIPPFRQADHGLGNVMFLPNIIHWQGFLALAVLYGALQESYNLVFGNGSNLNLHFLILAWSIVTLDTVLIVMHKSSAVIAKYSYFKPKNVWLIICDLVTAVPYFIGARSFTAPLPASVFRVLALLSSTVRLYRVVYIFYLFNRNLSIDTRVLNFVWFNLLLVVCSLLSANIFYEWKSVLLMNEVSPYSPLSEFIRFIATGYQFVIGNNFARYPIRTVLGHIVRLCVMYCGFIIVHYHFVPQVFVSYLRYGKHKILFRNFISHMITCVGLTGAKQSVKSSYILFYNEVWNFYKGAFSTKVADIYPIGMQKEMLVDIFWDAIQHSHLLKGIDIPLKRSIALLMTGNFYKPGDFLFRTGVTRCQMIYIVSGNIQILSDVDGTSPLATLSSGTVIGGSSIIFPSISCANVKCATFVEVVVLSISQLYSALKSHPWEYKYLKLKTYERLRDAEVMMDRARIARGRTGQKFGVRETRLKWIKKRWRLIYNCEKRPRLMKDETLWTIHDPSHTSKYLGLMAFSDFSGFQPCFCLSTKWPFVINPHSTSLRYWACLVTLTILLEAIMLPKWFCFKSTVSPCRQRLLTVIGFIFIVDIYLQLITADYVDGTLIKKPSKVILHRLKSVVTIMELISALPLSIYLFLFSPNTHDSTIFHVELLRLLKFYRVVRYFQKLEGSILASYVFIKAIRLILTFLVFHWWAACALYVVPCYGTTCLPDSWYATSQNYGKIKSFQLFTMRTPLKLALHYTQCIILKISFFPIKIVHPADLAMGVITLCLSTNLLVYIIGSFTATLFMRRFSVSAFSEYVLALNEVLSERCKLVSKQQRKGIFELVHLQWRFNEGAYIVFDRPIYLEAPRDLSFYFYRDLEALLKKIPLLQANNLPVSHFVGSLARHSTIHWVPRGRIITQACVIPVSLDLILKGHCNMISHLPEDQSNTSGVCLFPGECFPLMEVVHILPSQITVYTVTDCELLTIRTKDFHLILNANKPVKRRILSDTEKVYESLPVVNRKTMNFKVAVDINHSRWLTPSDSQVKPPKWSVAYLVSIIFLNYRINPDGKFIKLWELQRVIFILISLPFFIFYYTFCVVYFPDEAQSVAVIFDVMSFIDIYVRMNIGVIGKCGLIQTDPILSFWHYVNHAMFVDLAAAFPLYLILNISGPVTMFWFLLAICKCLPVYRIFNFIDRTQNSVIVYYRFLKFVKIILIFSVFIAFWVNILALQLCIFEYENSKFHRLSCRPAEFLDGFTPLQLLRVTFYVSTSFQAPNAMTKLLGSLVQTHTEELLVYHVISLFVKIVVMIYFCSYYVCKNSIYREYVIEVSNVISMMKDFKVKKELIYKVETFYMRNYRCVQSNWVEKKLRALHPSLKEQYNALCFRRCVKKVSFFKQVPEDMVRVIIDNLSEVFMPKDIGFISWNDLNNDIYIIHKGEVRVNITSSTMSHLLGPGSVFGCFNRKGNYRHMYSYVPTMHTYCLKMSSQVLYKIFDCFPSQNQIFIKSIQPCKEYLIEVNTKSQTLRRGKFPSLFSPENRVTKLLNFIYYYFLPIFTILGLSFYMAVSELHHLIYLIYFIDCMYLFKIYLSFTMPIVDSETGIMETYKIKIAKNYLKKVNQFALDVLSTIPFDLPFHLAGAPIKYLTLNRALRIWHLQLHYRYRKRNFRINLGFKLMDIFVYTFLVPITLSSIYCVWFGTSINIAFHSKKTDPFSTFAVLSMSIGMGAVGQYIDINVKSKKVGFLAVANLILFITFCLLVMKMLDLYELVLHNRDLKEYFTYKSKIFFQRRNLSNVLLKRAFDYSKMKFYRTGGKNLSGIMDQLPMPLKKATIYKKLQAETFGRNHLFSKTHSAMISQLTTRLHREIFFPNNFICIKGDVDGAIVFLKQGEIEVIQQGAGVYENVLTVLYPGDYFGIMNGLFPAHSYPHTYKARTVVDVFVLHRSSWLDLQRSFLTDTEEIYRRCNNVILQNIKLNNRILGIE